MVVADIPLDRIVSRSIGEDPLRPVQRTGISTGDLPQVPGIDPFNRPCILDGQVLGYMSVIAVRGWAGRLPYSYLFPVPGGYLFPGMASRYRRGLQGRKGIGPRYLVRGPILVTLGPVPVQVRKDTRSGNRGRDDDPTGRGPPNRTTFDRRNDPACIDTLDARHARNLAQGRGYICTEFQSQGGPPPGDCPRNRSPLPGPCATIAPVRPWMLSKYSE